MIKPGALGFRQSADSASRISEDPLLLTKDLGSLGTWQWDLSTNRITYCNNLRQLFGFLPGQFHCTYETFLAAIFEEDRDRVAKAMSAALSGSLFGLEFRVLRPDGSMHWLENRGKILSGADGSAARMIGITAEITELKLAQTLLSRENEFLRMLSTGTPLDEVLDSLCRSVEEQLPHLFSCLWVVDVPTGRLRQAAAPSLSASMREAMASTMIHLSESLCEPAGERPDAIIIADATADGRRGGLRDLLAAHRVKACWSMPIVSSAHAVLGVFALCSHQPQTPTQRDSELLRRATYLAALAIESRRSESVLRANEERFRQFFEDAPIGVAVVGPELRFIQVNRTLCRMLGYPEEELLGRTYAEMTHPDDVERNLILTKQAFAGETSSYRLEKRYHRKDGTVLWVNLTARVLQDREGSPSHMLAMIEDITERRRAAEALEESEGRLQFAMHLTQMGAWEWNVQTQAITYSEGLGPIFGLPRGAHHPDFETFLAAVHRDDRELVRGAVNALFQGAPDYEIEYRVVWSDGTVRWVAEKAHLYHDAGGKPLRMVGSAMDITDRIEAAAKLRLSEERYRALYDDNPSMYFSVAADGVILSVNRFGAHYLGYAKEELVGRSVLIVVHPDDHEIVTRSLAQCIERRAPLVHWEFRKVRKDGSVMWVREAARVLTDSQGLPVIMVTCEDISDRKHAEDVLRDREQQLRTALDDRVRMSQDLHDNILQSLYAVGLGLETSQSLITEDPRLAKRSISQGMELLNVVMKDIRQFIAGLEPDPRHGESLETALRRLADRVLGSGPHDFTVHVDPGTAEQLTTEQAVHLTNIAQEAISNSVQHARAGTGRLRLDRRRGSIRLEIQDDGIGFMARAVGSRGHGLRNMRARAKQLGGRLAILTKPGSGTRVVVTIPSRLTHDRC